MQSLAISYRVWFEQILVCSYKHQSDIWTMRKVENGDLPLQAYRVQEPLWRNWQFSHTL